MDAPTATIIVAAITIVPATIAAITGWSARRHAMEANDAVNHRHKTGTPRLYDLVLKNDKQMDELSAWKEDHIVEHKILNQTLASIIPDEETEKSSR